MRTKKSAAILSIAALLGASLAVLIYPPYSDYLSDIRQAISSVYTLMLEPQVD
ncbi:hypothetical protein [Citrobacter sp. JGM124]|uniref:hypothetical protein n=1 Tax=Citrobacter sp. JGM124 TaxID=2799789 RepID=UPI001BA8C88E|nr:hypothetical protein [Citrobacter sp. JGM124]MBS0847781.1 hypothetical protein [Citrobacter sp. JGM124]